MQYFIQSLRETITKLLLAPTLLILIGILSLLVFNLYMNLSYSEMNESYSDTIRYIRENRQRGTINEEYARTAEERSEAWHTNWLRTSIYYPSIAIVGITLMLFLMQREIKKKLYSKYGSFFFD